jgi:hypothetical protein
VVFPEPGGPQKIMEKSLSSSMAPEQTAFCQKMPLADIFGNILRPHSFGKRRRIFRVACVSWLNKSMVFMFDSSLFNYFNQVDYFIFRLGTGESFPLPGSQVFFEQCRHVKSRLPALDNACAGQVPRFLKTVTKRHFVS